MCSIVVALNENRPHILRTMAEAVRHRGPDSLEVWTNGNHAAAACRLTIFGDPREPMIFHDAATGRRVLFNGEIYNYYDLWKELEQQGRPPRTNLESDLIATLFDAYGIEFASRLKGMFAIAILDGSDLILARDRMGIKPLHYTIIQDKVLACSEIKGLLRHPDVPSILDLSALEETKVFGYIYTQTKTVFKGIVQVPPGSIIRFRGTQRLDNHEFGALPQAYYRTDRSGMGYEECVKKTKELVILAVERMFQHGRMDKAIFLSGGLDSSTMALVASRYLGYNIHTFTLADSPDTLDFCAARQVAAKLGADHHECMVTIDDYWRWLPDYVAHFESLVAGGVFHLQGGLAFHLATKFVAESFRVAFSGEGADELFGGYYWIYTHPRGFSDRIRDNLLGLEENHRLVETVNQIFPQPENESLYKRNLFDFLLRGGLSNYHLQSVDRSGGAFGMEIRPLYLDDDLSQWAMNLPIEFKVPDKQSTKKIFRDAFMKDFAEIGLEEIPTRLKMGMPSAVENLDKKIEKLIDRAVTDRELERHDLGRILCTKVNLFFYDLFEQIFINGWDHHHTSPPSQSMLSRIWPE